MIAALLRQLRKLDAPIPGVVVLHKQPQPDEFAMTCGLEMIPPRLQEERSYVIAMREVSQDTMWSW